MDLMQAVFGEVGRCEDIGGKVEFGRAHPQPIGLNDLSLYIDSIDEGLSR
jgi:hypothetical protein